jgi:hypothetical protein
MRLWVAVFFAFSVFAVTATAAPVVSNVRASQRAGTGLVDIYYDLASANALTIFVSISTNGGAAFNAPAISLSGDLGSGIVPATGKHVAWNAGTDLTALYFPNVKVRVTADDGLVAFYPFNGNANDASGNGNNATVYGATLTTNRYGNANSAYDFNGSSSYIDITQNSTLNNLTNFTLSAWIYQIGANVEYSYRILDKCPAGVPGGWTFDTWDGTTGHRLRLQAAGSSNPNVPGTTVYSLMQWHHVVATVSGTTGKVYLDGILDGTGNVGNIPDNALDIYIGRAHPNNGAGVNEWFNGIIEDVRIYNRALSDTEIQQLYNTP